MSNIGFSTSYKALEVPHGVIMGQVQIHNRGFEPFEFRTPGFRLTGSGGYMDSAMKCPDNQIPAGGVMQVSGGIMQGPPAQLQRREDPARSGCNVAPENEWDCCPVAGQSSASDCASYVHAAACPEGSV